MARWGGAPVKQYQVGRRPSQENQNGASINKKCNNFLKICPIFLKNLQKYNFMKFLTFISSLQLPIFYEEDRKYQILVFCPSHDFHDLRPCPRRPLDSPDTFFPLRCSPKTPRRQKKSKKIFQKKTFEKNYQKYIRKKLSEKVFEKQFE